MWETAHNAGWFVLVSLLEHPFRPHSHSGRPLSPWNSLHFVVSANQLHIFDSSAFDSQATHLVVGNGLGQFLILGGLEIQGQLVDVVTDLSDITDCHSRIDKLGAIVGTTMMATFHPVVLRRCTVVVVSWQGGSADGLVV